MEIAARKTPAWLPSLALGLMVLQGLFVWVDPAGWLGDPGVGWHLRSGQWILEEHHLPVEDPFSYTRPGIPWLNYQWGFHVFLGLLQQAGGLPLVVTVCSFLYALPPVWLMQRMMRAGADVVVAGLLALAVWMVMMQHTFARPHIFTYLFFTLYLSLLEGRRLGWLPVVMLFWCNLHGGFTAGLALVGIHAGMSLLTAWWQRGGKGAAERWHDAGKLWLALGACLLASLANPYGWNLHLHIWHYLQGDGARRMHEFLPVWRIQSVSVWVFYLLALGWLAQAVGKIKTRSVLDPGQVAGWFFLLYGFSAVRHIVLFALVAAPVLAQSLPGVGRRWKVLAAEQVRHPRVFVGWLCLLALFWTTLPRWTPGVWPQDLVGWNLGANSARVLDARAAELVPVFNSDHVGGSLAFRYYPHLRVFMDDRTDFYDSAFIEEVYLPVLEARPGWEQILDRYGIRGVVIKRNTPLGAKLRDRPDWRLLAEDPTSEVFLRVGVIPPAL